MRCACCLGLCWGLGRPQYVQIQVEVPGLLEKRPNVAYGDYLRFRFTAPNGLLVDREFVGYVHARAGTQLGVNLPASILPLLQQPARDFQNLFLGAPLQPRKGARRDVWTGPSGTVEASDVRWSLPLLCHLRFSYNRSGFNRMRRVLEEEELDRLLPVVLPGAITEDELQAQAREQEEEEAARLAQDLSRCSDKALNEEQRLAVERMTAPPEPLSLIHRPLVIFGPPGTGKTKTVVEGVLRAVLVGGLAAKVLCCAPSDAAADVIVQRLVAQAERIPKEKGSHTPWHEEGKWLLRLNHYTRAPETVRPDVVPYTFVDPETQLFTPPPLAEVLGMSVVVTTCGGAAILRNLGVDAEHWSLLVIDEAAQALEPETLIPLMLKGPRCRAVLTGDWQQLGPVVRSSAADALGLSKSLMERLTAHPFYKHSASRCLVRLTRNYRSHEQLLKVPSQLFYQQQLLACADPSTTDALLSAGKELLALTPEEAAQSKDDDAMSVDSEEEEAAGLADFPLLFYGVEGRDVREDDSPSFYNPSEALVVCSLVKKLLASSKFTVQPSDIGVIAPYRKQVQKIRLLLRKDNLDTIKVGTVDDYQGQEETIVFISTTLSHTERLNVDSEYSLGFLGNPRRFNVALTRAKSLCVVVGNPYVMLVKEHWKALLQHCINNAAYAGCPPPLHVRGEGWEGEWEEEDEEQLLALMQERMLGGGAVSKGVGQELDRLYRDEQEFRVIL